MKKEKKRSGGCGSSCKSKKRKIKKKEKLCKPSARNAGKEILDEMVHVFNTPLSGFEKLVAALPDKRKCPVYSQKEIIYGCLFMFLFRYDSRNNFNNNLNEGVPFDMRNCDSKTRKSFKKLFGVKVPHPDTIDNFLRVLPTKELEEIKVKLVQILFNRKTFQRYKFFGTYAIAVDGTGLGQFKTNVTGKLLCKETDKATIFYWYVVEAKLITSTGLCISLVTEWIENTPGYEMDRFGKQQCEKSALPIVMKKLHDIFPKLPITLCLDALFCHSNTFVLSKKFGWNYVITMKNTIASAREEIASLKKMGATTIINQYKDGVDIEYEFINEVAYNDPNHKLNWVSYKSTNKASLKELATKTKEKANLKQVYGPQEYPKSKVNPKKIDSYFEFVTNMTIDENNVEQIVELGRLRWKIENQGFDHQKHHASNIEHKYSRVSEFAMKNYYQCAQIAHFIEQLAMLSRYLNATKCPKRSRKFIFERIRSILIDHKKKEMKIDLSRKIMILK